MVVVLLLVVFVKLCNLLQQLWGLIRSKCHVLDVIIGVAMLTGVVLSNDGLHVIGAQQGIRGGRAWNSVGQRQMNTICDK